MTKFRIVVNLFSTHFSLVLEIFLIHLSATVESAQQLIHVIKWHLVNAENILEISFDNNKHPESSKRGIVNFLTGATFDFVATMRHYTFEMKNQKL